MPKRENDWPGGYRRKDRKGRVIFVIRRSVNGRRYEVSTRCTSERAALKQLERFEADPEGYDPRGPLRREPLFLTESLAQEFVDWSRLSKKNSKEWCWTQGWCLKWWAEKLSGIDLRGGVSLGEHIQPALDSEPQNRAHRIRVLKAFYGWLRKHRAGVRVTPQEDPTFSALPAPQARPEQRTRVKVIPPASLNKAREKIGARWRDVMDVQTATGWHVTEAIRFGEGGRVEDSKGLRGGGVLVCPKAKDGSEIRTQVSSRVVEAARRVRALGRFEYKAYNKAIKDACAEAGVEAFTPGRFRHTVATFAIEAGDDAARVSTFLNHKSNATMRAFYATHATPVKVKTLI